MSKTVTPRAILATGMPASRWKIVAEGRVIDTDWVEHGFSKRNRAANFYAAQERRRRERLFENIHDDIYNFDLEACHAALKILSKKNPYREVVEEQLKTLTSESQSDAESSQTNAESAQSN